MAESSRRTFLALTGAGAAAAGAAVVLPAGSADASTSHAAAHPGPLVAYVKNAKTGDIAVLVGEREVVVRDRALATRLAQIAASA